MGCSLFYSHERVFDMLYEMTINFKVQDKSLSDANTSAEKRQASVKLLDYLMYELITYELEYDFQPSLLWTYERKLEFCIVTGHGESDLQEELQVIATRLAELIWERIGYTEVNISATPINRDGSDQSTWAWSSTEKQYKQFKAKKDGVLQIVSR